MDDEPRDAFTRAARALASNPDSPASLQIMSAMRRALAPREQARNQLVTALGLQMASGSEKDQAAVDAAIKHWEITFKGEMTDADLADMKAEACERDAQARRMPPKIESILETRPSTTDVGYQLGVHLEGLDGTWHRLWAIISLAHSFGSDIDGDDGVSEVRGQFERLLGRGIRSDEWDALVAHAKHHAETETTHREGSSSRGVGT